MKFDKLLVFCIFISILSFILADEQNVINLLKEKENFLFLPTPLHKLENISKVYKKYNVFIKRDDMTGLAFGGNKSRKLEYILHDAKKKGADVLITYGSPQSNHARQTAAACKLKGLECYLILVLNKNSKLKRKTGNFLLNHILGVNIILAKNKKDAEAKLKELKEKLKKENKKHYFIPIGGSNAPGLLGYINTYKEILDQEIKLGVKFDYIIHASASLATQVGLILGKKVFKKDHKIIGVSITRHYMDLQVGCYQKAKILLGRFNKVYGENYKLSKEDFNIDERFMQGYERMGDNEKKSISLFAKKEAIILDPVYTGRAAGAMLHMMEHEELPENSNILFIHTGGTPLIFSDIYKLDS